MHSVVGPRENFERPGIRWARVEMEPERDHSPQDRQWSDCVIYPTLACPSRKAGRFSAFPNAHCQILVPRNKPIVLRRLCEKVGPDYPRLPTESIRGDAAERRMKCKSSVRRIRLEHIPDRGVRRRQGAYLIVKCTTDPREPALDHLHSVHSPPRAARHPAFSGSWRRTDHHRPPFLFPERSHALNRPADRRRLPSLSGIGTAHFTWSSLLHSRKL